jgi:hypothetical protein
MVTTRVRCDRRIQAARNRIAEMRAFISGWVLPSRSPDHPIPQLLRVSIPLSKMHPGTTKYHARTRAQRRGLRQACCWFAGVEIGAEPQAERHQKNIFMLIWELLFMKTPWQVFWFPTTAITCHHLPISAIIEANLRPALGIYGNKQLHNPGGMLCAIKLSFLLSFLSASP